VAIGPYEGVNDLILFGKRLAEQSGAQWIVVCVQTPEILRVDDAAKERLAAALRLAEILGAEAVTLDGESASETLTDYAHIRDATRIIVRARPLPTIVRFFAQDLANRLIRSAPSDVQVIAVTLPQAGEGALVQPAFHPRRSSDADHLAALTRYLRSLGIAALCTAIAYPLYRYFDPVNIAMLYVLGASIAGLRLGRGPSVLCAIASVAAFDFFFVPPRYSFYVAEPQYLVTLGVILGVALIIANLMVTVRRQTEAASARERHTATLYALTQELAVAAGAGAIAAAAIRHVASALGGTAAMLVADQKGELLEVAAADGSGTFIDRAVARWTFDQRRSAGPGMSDGAHERSLYYPLRGGERVSGVLVVQPPDVRRLLPEQRRLLEAFAGQLGLALERVHLGELAAESHAAAERAALRNTLLASISHDLRGPLSAIAGAGSLVAQANLALDKHRRSVLGQLIEEKAKDMTELLTNVLELMRLESSTQLARIEWQSLEEIVGTALRNNQHRLHLLRVTVHIPPEFPPVRLDGQLLVQLASNLLENAAKHTPAGTSVTVSAEETGGNVLLIVEDDGPGFGARDPGSLFEKFERGRSEGHVSGVGLGLAICRAIARLHGGNITASNRPEGGARFEVTLPLACTPGSQNTEAS
jgi:two-component system, OmpR family, sensor histidine kinase KdpD